MRCVYHDAAVSSSSSVGDSIVCKTAQPCFCTIMHAITCLCNSMEINECVCGDISHVSIWECNFLSVKL